MRGGGTTDVSLGSRDWRMVGGGRAGEEETSLGSQQVPKGEPRFDFPFLQYLVLYGHGQAMTRRSRLFCRVAHLDQLVEKNEF